MEQGNKDQPNTKDVNKAFTGMSISSNKKQFETFLLRGNGIDYKCVGSQGKGSFGTVLKAFMGPEQKVVAIKKVLQDPNYKNRELQIMKMLKHVNTVELIDSFFQKEKNDVFLYLILGYMPDNLYQVCSKYSKSQMPIDHIQSYMWQLFRALGYIHNLGICHRDIKPQNLIIDTETLQLRLCDFGSAKILDPQEQNVAYICSRYYRAPELIFGAVYYTNAIDIWSAGCVFAELFLGAPLLAGESGIDQLIEIFKVLGTPSRKQIHAMNPSYRDINKFPTIKKIPWEKLFPSDTPIEALDLMAKMLRYTPSHRILPLESLCHPFFKEFKDMHTKPEGPINTFFDFTIEELESARNLGVLKSILPTGELEKLKDRYSVDYPQKSARKLHQTSDSSSTEDQAKSGSSSDED